MLTKTLLLVGLALAGAKLFFPGKWRELGRRFNRVVNAILIAIVVVYSAQIAWWLVQGR